MMKTVHERINEIIIERLEKGIVPWRQIWHGEEAAPKNLGTGKSYLGINALLLGGLGFESPFFLSFDQARKFGGTVRKGEKAVPVVFRKWIDLMNDGIPVLDDAGQTRKIPLFRHYYVFNLMQCHGIAERCIPVIDKVAFEPLKRADLIVRGMPEIPRVEYDCDKAFYSSGSDTIHMPPEKSFPSREDMYAALFRELIHWTGHALRLKRQGITGLMTSGTEPHPAEELIAELGTCFLCSKAGIKPRLVDNSPSYIGAWLARLKNDKNLIVVAAEQARQACDFILDTKWKEKAKNERRGDKRKTGAEE